jgi:ribonuclease Y
VNIKRTELEKHQEEHIRRLEKLQALLLKRLQTQLVESLKQAGSNPGNGFATGHNR